MRTCVSQEPRLYNTRALRSERCDNCYLAVQLAEYLEEIKKKVARHFYILHFDLRCASQQKTHTTRLLGRTFYWQSFVN